ncbi:hypothetical protein I6E29_08140 [Arcanobacterium haemolyticum]|nr:hypothetical protein [Arcanobacterium haemolyticum]
MALTATCATALPASVNAEELPTPAASTSSAPETGESAETPDNTETTPAPETTTTPTPAPETTSTPSDPVADPTPQPGESATPAPTEATPQEGSRNYAGTVTLDGQWTNESTALVTTEREYTAATDKIGNPEPNTGLLRGLGKVFLGWSDKAPDPETGGVSEGGRLFSAEDTIATTFPEGLPQEPRLYGIYFSLNAPQAPLPTDRFSLGFALIDGMKKITRAFQSSSVTINPEILSADTATREQAAADTLPGTEYYSLEDTTSDDRVTTVITDLYETKDDTTKINEVALQATFAMDDQIAMLVYRNPIASNALRPVLSRNYDDLMAGTDELSTASGKSAGYTYVDLDVTLDEGIDVPEILNLEFSGYSWRPLYVLNADRTPLNIVDPATGNDLGATKSSFSTLVSNTDPTVRFGVKTAGAQHLTIRTILRHGENEKIAESSVVPAPGATIAETITQNMSLRALGTAELGADATDRVLRIKDEKAHKLATDDTPLTVTGTVSGLAVSDVGSIGSGWLSFPTESKLDIGPFVSNIVALDYHILYGVTYEFIAKDQNLTLPAAALAQLPDPEEKKENGYTVTPAIPTAVETAEGTWNFIGWHLGTYTPEADGVESATIDKANLHFIGVWDFVPAPKPEPEPTPDPTPDPEPTPDPTPDPEPTPDPTPDPEPTPDPTPDPEPTPDPTPDPEPEPSTEPSVEPSTTPSAEASTPAPEPTQSAAPAPQKPRRLPHTGAWNLGLPTLILLGAGVAALAVRGRGKSENF